MWIWLYVSKMGGADYLVDIGCPWICWSSAVGPWSVLPNLLKKPKFSVNRIPIVPHGSCSFSRVQLIN